MPITLIATPGTANANTYVTHDEVAAFAATLYPQPRDWTLAPSDDVRLRSIVTATAILDQQRYVGTRVASTQALEWPRVHAMKPGFYGTYYSETEIPLAVKRANARLAIWLAGQTNDPSEADELGGLTSLDLGEELSMTFEPTGGAASAGGESALELFLASTILPMLRGLVTATHPRLVRG